MDLPVNPLPEYIDRQHHLGRASAFSEAATMARAQAENRRSPGRYYTIASALNLLADLLDARAAEEEERARTDGPR